MPENENMPDSTTPDATTARPILPHRPSRRLRRLNRMTRPKDGELEQLEQKVDTTAAATPNQISPHAPHWTA